MSEWRETREAIRLFGVWKVLYWRFVYRRHMRWLHRRGGHQWTQIGPFEDGAIQLRCDWCGETTGERRLFDGEFIPMRSSWE